LSSAAFADEYRAHHGDYNRDYHRDYNRSHQREHYYNYDRDRHHTYQDQRYMSTPVIRNYDYVYYPTKQVYYSPLSSQWYWSNGSAWQSGRYLPSQHYVNASIGGVNIRLASALPYYEHAVISSRYPWHENHHSPRWNEHERYRHHERNHRREEYESRNWR